jgi:hypothetical protein
VIDAMGHGLDAAAMATIAVGAYRHARRSGISLAEKYAFMDQAIAEQFGPDHFVTAQMMDLNIHTGHLQWVNAGHPAPLLIRNRRVTRSLESPTTLPVGFGGAPPQISAYSLQPGDRVLCYTDGLIEERDADGVPFGEERLIRCVNRVERAEARVRADGLRLSRALKRERGGRTSDTRLCSSSSGAEAPPITSPSWNELVPGQWLSGDAGHSSVPPQVPYALRKRGQNQPPQSDVITGSDDPSA